MPEDLKVSQNGSSLLPPPFRGLHSPGVRKHCQIIFRKSSIITVYMQATSGRGRKPRCRLYTSCLPCWTAVLFKVEDGVRSSGSYLENLFRNALGNLQTSVLGHLCHVQIQQLTQEQCQQELGLGPHSLSSSA